MLDNSTIHIMILHNIMLQFVSRKLAVGGKRVFSIFFIQFTFFTWLGTLRMISISYSAEKWSKLRFRNWSERCNSRRLRKSITRSIRSPKSSWTRIIWKGKKRKFFFLDLNNLTSKWNIQTFMWETKNAIAPLYICTLYIHRVPKRLDKFQVKKLVKLSSPNCLLEDHYRLPFF